MVLTPQKNKYGVATRVFSLERFCDSLVVCTSSAAAAAAASIVVVAGMPYTSSVVVGTRTILSKMASMS